MYTKMKTLKLKKATIAHVNEIRHDIVFKRC